MGNNRLVWDDDAGDLRKQNTNVADTPLDLKNIKLSLRRLTAGKGRTVIEISNLPANKPWCQKLAKNLKKNLGVGGTYKKDIIEIHGEKINEITSFLDKNSISWKKTGG